MTATESEGFTKKPCFPRIMLRSWWRQERNSSYPCLAQKGCDGRSCSTWQVQPINAKTQRYFWLHWNKYRVLKKLNSNTCIVFHLPADFSQLLKLLKYSLDFIINTVANYCHGGKLQQVVHFYLQLQRERGREAFILLCLKAAEPSLPHNWLEGKKVNTEQPIYPISIKGSSKVILSRLHGLDEVSSVG